MSGRDVLPPGGGEPGARQATVVGAPADRPAMPDERTRRLLSWALVAAAVALVTFHLAAIYTENINWDEFAIFFRTAEMFRTGQLQGGGRPGAAELVLAPIVRGCTDAIAVAQVARAGWTLFYVAGLAGLFELLRRLRRRRPHPVLAAALGVALVALVPAHLRWSLHVRTDHAAIAFGLWATVLLIESRHRTALAFPAGLLFGAGFLFSQKLAYLGILAVLLTLGDRWVEATPWARGELGRWVARAVLCAVGGALVIVGYRTGVARFVALPDAGLIPATGDYFARYRANFGLRPLYALLPTLLSHFFLLALLLRASIRAARAREEVRALVVAWTVLLAGVGVVLFHAANFPYFWMTWGLFPAVALAWVVEDLLAAIPAETRRLGIALLVAGLLVPAALYGRRLLADTQAPQREALEFVARNFEGSAAGLQLEGALFCRREAKQFPVLFREGVQLSFFGAGADARVRSLLADLREAPVRFLVVSFGYGFFPREIKTFLYENYHAYAGPVRLAGRRLAGKAGESAPFELIVSGEYRWFPPTEGPTGAIAIDGVPLEPLKPRLLEAGEHRVEFGADVSESVLLLAVADPPAPGAGSFYSASAIREIVGQGYD